jgi:hypothetical protein
VYLLGDFILKIYSFTAGFIITGVTVLIVPLWRKQDKKLSLKKKSNEFDDHFVPIDDSVEQHKTSINKSLKTFLTSKLLNHHLISEFENMGFSSSAKMLYRNVVAYFKVVGLK